MAVSQLSTSLILYIYVILAHIYSRQPKEKRMPMNAIGDQVSIVVVECFIAPFSVHLVSLLFLSRSFACSPTTHPSLTFYSLASYLPAADELFLIVFSIPFDSMTCSGYAPWKAHIAATLTSGSFTRTLTSLPGSCTCAACIK